MTAKISAGESIPIKSFKWTDDEENKDVAKLTLNAIGSDESIEMKLTKSDEEE